MLNVGLDGFKVEVDHDAWSLDVLINLSSYSHGHKPRAGVRRMIWNVVQGGKRKPIAGSVAMYFEAAMITHL